MTERLDAAFRARVAAHDFPPAVSARTIDDAGLAPAALAEVFESQLSSRRLDLLARRLGKEKRGFYSIGSSGHEGNAAVARAFRRTDMAFLHYRSGAFLIERLRQVPGATPLYDMALSFVASSDDPVSGGRHKVLGSKAGFVPPQTSTIASHLPKAVGAAFAVALSRTHRRAGAMPHDAVILCSFGDASANHSTAQGAINSAAWSAYQNLPCPIVFVCEDNGLGISVPTPAGWIGARFGAMPGIAYLAGDGRDLVDAYAAAREAEAIARSRRAPVFLHLRTVRLMGHAGSDIESAYRPAAAIEAAEADDPLLHSARRVIEAGVMSAEDILALDDQLRARLDRIAEDVCGRPKLTTPEAVAAPIVAPATGAWRIAPPPPPLDPETRARVMASETRALAEPQHMSKLISLALADLMAEDPGIVVFGEDVGKKGGVYGATVKLQDKFGPSRVFDTLLDEQTILGLAIGLAHQGYVPIPEIQFLAYVHNAEDQIRGEAATLSFFSNGQFANPMVIRIAGLGYQKGFGGHFHNDNALAVFRDIPGLILACPSNGAEAVGMLREAVRLARAEGRVVVFLEPIALYPVKDLYEDGDGRMLHLYPEAAHRIPFGSVGVEGDGRDVAILTYANGAYLARRAVRRLAAEHGVAARVIDLRWLKPLPMAAIREAAAGARAILVVDECRQSGGPSEELITRLIEAGETRPLSRITATDSFIPLGPAATIGLPSEDQIVSACLALSGARRPADADAA